MDLINKVALVTGAASGIGLAIVQELLVNNVQGVVMVDVDSNNGKEISEDLSTKYGPDKIVFVQADVRKNEQYEEAFKTAIKKYKQLDIVVNNAGIATDTEYEKTIAINLIGVVRGTLLGLKYLGKNALGKGGVILNTASIIAIEEPFAVPVYAATKAGVVNFTRGYNYSRYTNETGVRVVAILPGFTESNIMATAKHLDEIFTNVASRRPIQTALAVARGALHAIENGQSGSTWVIEDSKLYLLPPPEKGSYGTLINDDLNKIA